MNRRIFVAFVVLAVVAVFTPCQAQPVTTGPASVFSVKFVCGLNNTPVNLGALPSEPPVKPGNYATAVNIHNFHTFPVFLCKKAVLAPPEGCLNPAVATPGCFPSIVSNFRFVTLHADQAFEVDCNDIVNLLTPSLPAGTALPSFIKGFVELVVLPQSNGSGAGSGGTSPSLSVTGVYTAQGCKVGRPGNKCEELGGIAEEVVPQNSFIGELPPPPTTCVPG